MEKVNLLLLLVLVNLIINVSLVSGYLVYCSRSSSSTYTISTATSTLSSDGINGMWASKVFDIGSTYGIVAVEGRFYMDGFLYKIVWETGNGSATGGAKKPPVEAYNTSTHTKGYYSVDELGTRFRFDSQVSVISYRYYCGF